MNHFNPELAKLITKVGQQTLRKFIMTPTSYSTYNQHVPFNVLLGKIFTKIESSSTQIDFHTKDGVYVMYHSQDCCESVYVEDTVGDLDDLVGSEILVAEESTSRNCDADGTPFEDSYDTCTWTFYKLGTIKGWVDIRWFGSSNGYYSESVDLAFVPYEFNECDPV